MVSKNEVRDYAPGTPHYVVLHGARQIKNGKNPSVSLHHNNKLIKNPAKAYKLAQKLAKDTDGWLTEQVVFMRTGKSLRSILRMQPGYKEKPRPTRSQIVRKFERNFLSDRIFAHMSHPS